MYHVLLVDDDPHILIANQTYLTQRGYKVFAAKNGADALSIAATAALDAVNGGYLYEDMFRLRETSSVPVLFLSAFSEPDDRIRGLMAGGDDYLGKPYSLVELELRLRLRIEGSRHFQAGEVLQFGPLEIDLGLRQVRYQGATASFTTLEFDLLAFLARNPGQVFSYEQLYNGVWKSPINQSLHNIQVCMARVRQKLDLLCPGENYIETIRRKGYRFRSDKQV